MMIHQQNPFNNPFLSSIGRTTTATTTRNNNNNNNNNSENDNNNNDTTTELTSAGSGTGADPWTSNNHDNGGNTTATTGSSLFQSSPSSRSEESVLSSLIQSFDWPATLARIISHPSETRLKEQEGRTPLHLACEQDAPAVVIQSLLKAYPEASIQVTSSNMTPLHVTCSSSHASVHAIRVLLELGVPAQYSMRDLDGDTPLHAACRCGASIEVLEVLLKANPSAVHQRDFEGLTPLLRLWVRYTVMLGEDVLDVVTDPGDLIGELGEAWKKTELLLRCAHLGTIHQQDGVPFRLVHAASSVDCPRHVVRIATIIFPRQLEETDEQGRTPLMLAAGAPIYKVRDLSDEGYLLEDVIHGDESSDHEFIDGEFEGAASQPSVIDLLLQANQELAGNASNVPDNAGRLPIHVALKARKRFHEGVKTLVENYPDALGIPHPDSKLYPFMLAGEGDRGDISICYELLRLNPSVLDEVINGKKRHATAVNVLLSNQQHGVVSGRKEPPGDPMDLSRKTSVTSLLNLTDKAILDER